MIFKYSLITFLDKIVYNFYITLYKRYIILLSQIHCINLNFKNTLFQKSRFIRPFWNIFFSNFWLLQGPPENIVIFWPWDMTDPTLYIYEIVNVFRFERAGWRNPFLKKVIFSLFQNSLIISRPKKNIFKKSKKHVFFWLFSQIPY